MNAINHVCKTCGAVEEKASGLCDPMSLNNTNVCGRCGGISDHSDNLCCPEKQNINFTCISCGRGADLPQKLCNPRDIVLMQRDDPPTRIF